MKCYDHLGNEYPSKEAMCRHYGISTKNVYYKRLAAGWSLKDTLTVPSKREHNVVPDYNKLYTGRNGCYVDHLGNYYSQLQFMCDCWEVDVGNFIDRVRNGWGVETALTYRNNNMIPRRDDTVIWVFGEPFPTYSAVDAAYGFSRNACCKHKNDIEGWLESKGLYYIDEQLFRTATSLCAYYKISEGAFRSRRKRGMSLYDSVHTPVVRSNSGKPCFDHEGNEFSSASEMHLFYGVSSSAFYNRIKSGWSLKDALTVPVKSRLSGIGDKFIARAKKEVPNGQ